MQESPTAHPEVVQPAGRRAPTGRRRWREVLRQVAMILLVLPGALLFLTPWAWMILTAGKESKLIWQIPPVWIPPVYRWQNFGEAWLKGDFATFYTNTLFISLLNVAAVLISCSIAAYAFARMRFHGRTLAFMAIVMSRLVPAVALAVPFYLLIQALGLLGTKTALILVHAILTLPFTVLILSVFFRRIPVEIEDAAIVDGCSRLQLFWRIVLPLSLPSLAATGLFAFMLSYAEFLFALVLSGDAANRPLAVVMASLARNVDVSWGLLNSAIFLAVLPSLLLVAIVWRMIVEGILVGGVKG